MSIMCKVTIERHDKGFIVKKNGKSFAFNTIVEVCEWLQSLEGI
jgi:hypothetical protein